jgi:biotin transport system substrate-specific component
MENIKKISTRKSLVNTTLTALFAALISAGAFVAIPLPFTPVPISIQNLFAVLSGIVLGPLFGALAVLLYLGAGALGIPVFAGATGGFVHFASPSGGYLFGYLLAAAVAGLVSISSKRDSKISIIRIAVAAFAGMCVVYIPGLVQLKIILTASWPETFVIGLVPFIIGDVIKIGVLILTVPRLRKAVSIVLQQ